MKEAGTGDYRDVVKHTFLDFMQMKDFAAHPLIMKRAYGVWYEDVNGKKYLDGLAGIFTVNAGHANKRIIRAITRQLEQIAFAPPLLSTNLRALELSKLLRKVLPKGLHTIKLFSGGSEATEAAMKLSRQFHRQTGNPHKYKVISNYRGYHGATMGALGASGVTKRKTPFEPFGPGYIHVLPPTCYRCPYGLDYPNCAILCAEVIEKVVKEEDPSTVSAMIVEPISNTGGIVTPPLEYFKILREIADRHKIVLILDEVITGFGRTGKMFGAQTFQVTPDIIAMGKGMSSGYSPVGGIAFNDEIADAFYGKKEDNVHFNHGHTFGGNPLSCAASVASVSEIRDRDLPRNAREMGARVWKRLEEMRKLGIVGDIRGKGLFVGLEYVKNTKTRVQFPEGVDFGLRVGKKALEKGLIVRSDPHWTAFAPPLTINKGETDTMMDIYSECVEETLREVS